MKFIYTENGLQCLIADDNFVPPGDAIVFDHKATETELIAVFPDYQTSLQAQVKAVNNAEILAKIAELEVKQSRPLREYVLTMNSDSLSRVQAIETQITTLREQLQK